MTKTVECTGRAFRGLVNRYTGEPMKVFMLVSPDKAPRFFAPDAYDPSRTDFPTAQEAYSAWSRVNGIAGLRKGAPVCAYTGEMLVPVQTPFGHRFRGGFSPTTPQSREAFLAGLRGVPAEAETHVEPAPEETPAPVSRETDLDAHVESAVRELADGPKGRCR